MNGGGESGFVGRGDWLEGYVEIEPAVVVALLALCVFALVYHLWRRARNRRRDGRFGLPEPSLASKGSAPPEPRR